MFVVETDAEFGLQNSVVYLKVTHAEFGEVVTRELEPGGSEKYVTKENRYWYFQLITQHCSSYDFSAFLNVMIVTVMVRNHMK